MKNLATIIYFLLLLNIISASQENYFKPVFIAKDVIDNFITATGGKDKIEKIHTIKIEGSINKDGKILNLTRYVNGEYIYQIMQSHDYCQITTFNDKVKKGWYTYNGRTLDFDKNAFEYYQLNTIQCYSFYLDGYDLGINYVLDEIGNTDTSVYCVKFIKDETLLSTMYFDKTTFYKVKSICNGQERFYSDFRKAGDRGIVMPFLIVADDSLVVTNYKFNQSFNKQLLDKKSLNIFSPGD